MMTSSYKRIGTIGLLSSFLILISASLSAQKIDNVNFRKFKSNPKGHEQDAYQLLKRVVAQIEAHDWSALMSECDPEHKKFQLENMEMSESNYLAEIMGLHYVDNTISPDDKPITFDKLNLIGEVWFTKFAKKSIFENEIFGTVTFNDGTKELILKLRFHWDDELSRFWLYCSAG